MPEPNASSRSAIVLVVEDEPIQRHSLVDLLEESGYAPLEAWDASSALAILESRADVRLVVSDVDMPGGMNGIQLAAMVRDRWPPIELLIISAKPPPDLTALPARSVFLSKPLDADKLLRALQALAAEIDERPSPAA